MFSVIIISKEGFLAILLEKLEKILPTKWHIGPKVFVDELLTTIVHDTHDEVSNEAFRSYLMI